jgi:hypothetical protein
VKLDAIKPGRRELQPQFVLPERFPRHGGNRHGQRGEVDAHEEKR